MEGLILEVKADISQFEMALARLQTVTDGALAGFNDSLSGLGEAVSTATAGMEEFSSLIREQDQSWTSSGNALAVYNAGLTKIKTGMSGLADRTAKAVARVKDLKLALDSLPRKVEIEIVLKQTGSLPKFHAGGFVAGPALSPPLAHGGMYVAPPGPEERDVRVLTGEYILSRSGVRNLGLAALRAADRGGSANGPDQAGQPARIENHYHLDSMIKVGGSLVADEASLSEFAERIGQELDWQAQGRTG
jgi:hypothetical protein